MLSKYVALAKADLLEKVSYVGSQLFQSFFIVIIIFIFFRIWGAIYAGKELVEGFSMAQMLWYLAVAEIIVISSELRWIETISEEIKTGVIATTLLKPISYVWSKFALFMGNFVYKSVVSSVLCFVVAWLLVGVITVSVQSLFFSIVSIVLGAILNFAVLISLGFLAFWLEESSALFWIYQKGFFILGGMLVPLNVYPDWLRDPIINLPFSYMIYKPVKLFVQFDFSEFVLTILWQLGWLVVLGFVAFFIYEKGVKQVQINGG